MKFVSYYELLGLVKDNVQPDEVEYNKVHYTWNKELKNYVKMIGDFPADFLHIQFKNIASEIAEHNICYDELPKLTDKERDYLEVVLEPYREVAYYIHKDVGRSGQYGRIVIECKDDKGEFYSSTLPKINVEKEYLGLKPFWNYSLKDLKLYER